MEKELKIAVAVRAQEAWRSEMVKTLRDLHTTSLKMVNDALDDTAVCEKVGTEVKVVKQRSQACALILALADHTKTYDEQPVVEESAPSLTAEALATASSPTPKLDGAGDVGTPKKVEVHWGS